MVLLNSGVVGEGHVELVGGPMLDKGDGAFEFGHCVDGPGVDCEGGGAGADLCDLFCFFDEEITTLLQTRKRKKEKR